MLASKARMLLFGVIGGEFVACIRASQGYHALCMFPSHVLSPRMPCVDTCRYHNRLQPNCRQLGSNGGIS